MDLFTFATILGLVGCAGIAGCGVAYMILGFRLYRDLNAQMHREAQHGEK